MTKSEYIKLIRPWRYAVVLIGCTIAGAIIGAGLVWAIGETIEHFTQ